MNTSDFSMEYLPQGPAHPSNPCSTSHVQTSNGSGQSRDGGGAPNLGKHGRETENYLSWGFLPEELQDLQEPGEEERGQPHSLVT